MSARQISVIVATTQKGGIGKDGTLPWKLPEDMAHFKKVTTAAPIGKMNAVVMGRKTWESIPTKFKPLSDRLNVVLSKSSKDSAFASTFPAGVLLASSVEDAMAQLSTRDDVSEIFAIGGESVYKEVVEMSACARIFLTRIAKDIECDAFFPAFDDRRFKLAYVSKSKSCDLLPYDFVVYERIADAEDDSSSVEKIASPALAAVGRSGEFLHDEYQYLNLVQEIIDRGVSMEDRTGVGTVSIFGTMMRFDLRRTFPLLTTKRVFWRGVVEELLWFVKGDTNAKHLSEKGVKIWDGNGSREFLDKRGLSHREEGDLGPVYGFQWRHFGAKYVDMHADYTGQGVDQLADCIKKIKEDPTDRRILLSAWNPADLGLMALPPCHMFCQFYVANGELSCLMYQRSCDIGLGVPFNIASYSLLTCMMAQVCGLKPGDFIHQMGNTHVYKNHVEPLKTQLERAPRPFPTLRMNPDVKDIDGFQASDFELLGYNPHGKIAMDMAV
jgi:dihydrofolate reductase/thymidylate synthase|mmetsp:Transcript_95234/g.150602  ORF Transcript_95234/g.150602 Transcript_95234/m.150602 type:complete len:497 (+) Transcript_95234:58-1548(+)